jgi:hypothetical protein
MDYEDRFHPSEGNDLLENDMRNMVQFKALDKGFHKIKQTVDTPNGRKIVTYELYSSGDQGSNIRDAISGQYCVGKVGSKDEDSFFKLTISTGEVRGERRNFYFQSPEVYERHMHTTLDVKTKESWLKKQLGKK